jgi:hypothetical protein
MTRHTKGLVALLGALATWGITAAEDNTYTQVELWGALLALATAAGVWLAPNRSPNVHVFEEPQRDAGLTLVEALLLVLVVLVVLLLVGAIPR